MFITPMENPDCVILISQSYRNFINQDLIKKLYKNLSHAVVKRHKLGEN